MTLPGLLAGYFTLFVGGAGLALMITKGSSRLNLIECVCLAWLLGVGLVSLMLWLFGIFASGLMLQSLVTAACLAFGIIGWRVKQRDRVHISVPRPNGTVEWILTSLLLIELVAIFFISLKHTLGWDGLLNWELKARYAFLNSGVLPESYYSRPGRAFSHPEYPLGLPFTELWFYLWMGSAHQFWIKTIFPCFYIAGALLVGLFVTRLTGNRMIGLLVALLLPFVPFVTASPGGVIVGYADSPLSVFYLAALGYLLCSLECNVSYSFAAYTASLTLMPWVKSEGAVLWSLLVLMGLVAGLYQSRLRRAILSILPGLLLIISWRVYLKVMNVVMPSDFARPTLHLFRDNLNRVTGIIGTAFAEVTATDHWSIFWLLAVTAVIYLCVTRRLSRLLLAVGVLGPMILYLLTYIFSAWPSYTAHMTSSLPRLFLHVMPAAWLAIGLALASPITEPVKSKLG